MVIAAAFFALGAIGLAAANLLAGAAVPLLTAASAAVVAVVLYLSRTVPAFVRILIGLVAAMYLILLGLNLADEFGLLPPLMAAFAPPTSTPVLAGILSLALLVVGRIPVMRTILHLTDPYFASTDRGELRLWPFPAVRAQERHIAAGLLAISVFLNFAMVAISVRFSYFNRDWFNAIQERNAGEFWRLLISVWAFWVVIGVAMAIYQYAVQQTLVIRWRAWLTQSYTQRWLGDSTHYRMQLLGGQTDNPDQRIQEDIRKFTQSTLSLTLDILYQISTLISFSVILWNISGGFTIPGTDIAVPGLMFWIALVYASVATVLAHLIGRPLIGLNFLQERFEADFRFSLARLREYGEQVSLLRGERAERERLNGQFASVIDNFFRIVGISKQLIAFTSFYNYSNSVVPYVIAAPFYFAGKIPLGVMTQTAGAFARVENALSFFITTYQTLADYKAVVDRLVSFEKSVARARAAHVETGAIALAEHGAPELRLDEVVVRLPDGKALVRAAPLVLAKGQSALLVGPSGSGKSTLFRAISGIWPFGEGRILRPAGASLMLLPQRPYIPVGSLRGAVAYPASENGFTDEAIADALRKVRLGHLVDQLDADRAWAQTLSLGEQQRLALARALLARPDWLLLDEATAAMDEPTEAEMYRVLRAELPDATVVSIGHRSTLAAFHERRIVMEPAADGLFAPGRPEPAAAAE